MRQCGRYRVAVGIGLLLLASLTAQATPLGYRATDLGVAVGFASSVAYGVSDAGGLVGDFLHNLTNS